MAKFKGKEHNKASIQGDIGAALSQLGGGVANGIGGLLGTIFPPYSQSFPGNTVQAAQPAAPAPPAPPPAAPQQGRLSEEQIQQALQAFAPDTPLATQSGVLAQALQQLDPAYDPRMLIALALKESRGGKDLLNPDRQLGGRREGINNPFNVMPGGDLVNYPDLKTALTGGPNELEGHPSRGLVYILNEDPAYAPYRQSGNMDDFFQAYSPPGKGNADLKTQQAQIDKLLRLFKEAP